MLKENRDVLPRTLKPLVFLSNFLRRLNWNRYSLKTLPDVDGGNALDDGTAPAFVPIGPNSPVLVGSYAQPLPRRGMQEGDAE